MKGLYTKITSKGEVKVFSQLLVDEPIYDDVTVDTALRNQLKDQLIKLAL
jgi:hypothetical protein